MCQIVVCERGDVLSRDECKIHWELNPHGAGIMYSQGGEIRIQKFMNFDDFFGAYSDLDRNLRTVVHFRYSTSGKVNLANCHPFWVFENELAMAHNGVFPRMRPRSGENDTMAFIRSVLLTLPFDFPENAEIMRKLESGVGERNRLIFLRPNGDLSLIGDWAKSDSRLYSDRSQLTLLSEEKNVLSPLGLRRISCNPGKSGGDVSSEKSSVDPENFKSVRRGAIHAAYYRPSWNFIGPPETTAFLGLEVELDLKCPSHLESMVSSDYRKKWQQARPRLALDEIGAIIGTIEGRSFVKRDYSLGPGGIEMVTHPVAVADSLTELRPVFERLSALRMLGFCGNEKTGLHIHVTKDPFESTTWDVFGKVPDLPKRIDDILQWLPSPMQRTEKLFPYAIYKNENIVDFLTFASKRISPNKLDYYAAFRETGNRYQAINLTEETIEFRFFQSGGTLDYVRDAVDVVRFLCFFFLEICNLDKPWKTQYWYARSAKSWQSYLSFRNLAMEYAVEFPNVARLLEAWENEKRKK